MKKASFNYLRSLFFALTTIIFLSHFMFAQTAIEIKTDIETKPELLIREAAAFQAMTVEQKTVFKLEKEPKYRTNNPLYGKIILGNLPSKKNIVVVIDEAVGMEPRIYIDANNNFDLTDDGIPEWTKSENGGYSKDVKIRISFIENGKRAKLDLPFTVTRFQIKDSKQPRIVFQSKSARTGLLKIGDNIYKILAQTFNSQALYSNPQDVTLGIDTNKDGEINKSLLSPEIFWGGNFGGKPFNIGGETYRIARISESGDTIVLEVSPKKVAAKIPVSIDSPAPDFKFQTLDRKTVSLSELKGKVVLLDFWAIWCSPCIANLPDIKKIYDKHNSNLEIIGISLDGGENSKIALSELQNFTNKERMNWLIAFDNGGWENTIAKKYNVTGIPINIVIDKNGIIRLIERGGGSEKLNKIEKLIEQLTK